MEGNVRLTNPGSIGTQQLYGQLSCFFKDIGGMVPRAQHFDFLPVVVFYITWTSIVKDDKVYGTCIISYDNVEMYMKDWIGKMDMVLEFLLDEPLF